MAKAKPQTNEEITQTPPEAQSVPPALMGLLEALTNSVESINKRLDTIETGGKNAFKTDIKNEDIESAKEGREGVDAKMVRIVDEMLGEDFKIKLEDIPGSAGKYFTLIVPKRLSLLEPRERPLRDESGKYLLNQDNSQQMETYFPDDRRSVMIFGADSIDKIKEHCERVRANIVVTYQKLSKPLPEFKVRSL